MQNTISIFPTQESVQDEISSRISEIIPDNKNKIFDILSDPTMKIFQKKILQEYRRKNPNEDLLEIYTTRILDFTKHF